MLSGVCCPGSGQAMGSCRGYLQVSHLAYSKQFTQCCWQRRYPGCPLLDCMQLRLQRLTDSQCLWVVYQISRQGLQWSMHGTAASCGFEGNAGYINSPQLSNMAFTGYSTSLPEQASAGAVSAARTPSRGRSLCLNSHLHTRVRTVCTQGLLQLVISTSR